MCLILPHNLHFIQLLLKRREWEKRAPFVSCTILKGSFPKATFCSAEQIVQLELERHLFHFFFFLFTEWLSTYFVRTREYSLSHSAWQRKRGHRHQKNEGSTDGWAVSDPSDQAGLSSTAWGLSALMAWWSAGPPEWSINEEKNHGLTIFIFKKARSQVWGIGFAMWISSWTLPWSRPVGTSFWRAMVTFYVCVNIPGAHRAISVRLRFPVHSLCVQNLRFCSLSLHKP